MAEYQMQTSNLPNEDGEKILFPRIKIWGQVDLDYLAQRINYASTFTPGDIIGLVKSLTQAIAREMGEGHSVKVDGLGVFTPSLGLREGFERESAEQGGQKRNVSSICVDNINFRADKDYADIARFMGWGTDKQSDAELVELLAQKVYELGIAVGIDMNWKGQGVTKKLLQDTAYTLAEHAYEDQCTTANPKEPLISELKEIIEIAFDYKG